MHMLDEKNMHLRRRFPYHRWIYVCTDLHNYDELRKYPMWSEDLEDRLILCFLTTRGTIISTRSTVKRQYSKVLQRSTLYCKEVARSVDKLYIQADLNTRRNYSIHNTHRFFFADEIDDFVLFLVFVDVLGFFGDSSGTVTLT